MAITNVSNYDYNGTDTNQQILEYQGLTTDTKPTLTAENNGSTFLAINDTTDQVETLYIYNHPTWNEV